MTELRLKKMKHDILNNGISHTTLKEECAVLDLAIWASVARDYLKDIASEPNGTNFDFQAHAREALDELETLQSEEGEADDNKGEGNG